MIFSTTERPDPLDHGEYKGRGHPELPFVATFSLRHVRLKAPHWPAATQQLCRLNFLPCTVTKHVFKQRSGARHTEIVGLHRTLGNSLLTGETQRCPQTACFALRCAITGIAEVEVFPAPGEVDAEGASRGGSTSGSAGGRC
jgi:hypothetical protein